MAGTINRKRVPLRHPKAGEPLPEYGAAGASNSFRRELTARERATIDKALGILGRWLTAERDVLENPEMAMQYLQLHLGGERCEHFAVLFLDGLHRCIAFERMFTGTLTQTSVYPREVVLAALRHNAAAVVLAHNHPSGSVKPSRADEALTQSLKSALALVDVRVLDHIIVSVSGVLSMAEKGMV